MEKTALIPEKVLSDGCVQLEEDSALAYTRNRPIFIVGAARSGTTLLQFMLRSHPRISAPPGESHFIVPLARRRAALGDLRDPRNVRRILLQMRAISPEFTAEDLQGLVFNPEALAPVLAEHGDGTLGGLIRSLFAMNAAGEGKSRWADKTPYYVLHMPLLLDLFPDAQFVHIVRDGRDCAVSMLRRRHELRIYNVYHAAQAWSQYVDAGQRHGALLASDQYFEIRYEELLAAPEKTLAGLCRFLNEEYSSSLINYTPSSVADPAKTRLGGPLATDNTGKWREALSRWQVRVFESEAGETLARNGYPLATRTGRLPLPVRACFRAHLRASHWVSRRWINPPRLAPA